MPFAHTALARTGSNEFSYRTNDLQGEVLAVSYFDPAKVIGLKAMDIIVVTAAIGGARPEVLTVLVTATVPSVVVQAVSDSLRDSSLCLVPAGLGWDASSYPISLVSYRDMGGVRVGSISGYSPWASAEYLSCRGGTQIYVSATGSDSSGAGTIGSPYLTVNKAIQIANAAGQPATIWLSAGAYFRNASGGYINAPGSTTLPTVPFCLMAYGGIVQYGCIDNYTFVADTTYTNTHKIARSSAGAVYNPSLRDSFGNAVMYTKAVSAAACNARPGSWYTDGTSVYVNSFDGSAVTNATASVYLTSDTFAINWGSAPQHFFMDVADDGSSWDLLGSRVKIIASAYGASPKIIAMRRVSTRYASSVSADAWNGFGFDNWWGLIWLESCYAGRASADCINFHNTLNAQPLYAVTLNCQGVDAGVFGSGSNNGLTLHENVIGIDVAGRYRYNQGGTLRNINTSKMLAHGSTFSDDRGDLYISGGLVPPTEVGTLNTAQIWLSECTLSPGSDTAYAINIGSGGAVFLRNMPTVRGRVSGSIGTW
ncbi:hypothetical protein V5F34_21735 [Xanthobacter autotrophicus]|uniref:hypothetical protein n=1 Tax=Xanthobacter autotrophicus TaxID=280 RepID=UPI0037265E05